MKVFLKACLVTTVLLSSVTVYSAPPLPPPPQNAALLYYQVFLSMKLPGGDNDTTWTKIRDYAEGKTSSSQEIRSTIESLTLAKSYAIKAADLKQCDWGTDFSLGIDTILPFLGLQKKMTRVMLADARLAAEAGDYTTAVDRCLTSYKMSRHANNGFTLIGFLVANGIDNMTHQCFRNVLINMPKNTTILDRIKEQLRYVQTDRISFSASMEYDFNGIWQGLTLKRVVDLSLVDAKHEKLKNDIKAYMGTAAEQDFLNRNRANGEKFLKKQVEAIESKLAYAEKFEAVKRLNKQLSEEGKTNDNASLAACMVPSYERAFLYDVRNKAFFNAFETAIDVYQIQLNTGSLPDALPDDTLKDPFSGKPFIYEKKGNHFTLRCQAKDLLTNKIVTFEF